MRKMLKMSYNVVTLYRSSNWIFVIMIAGTVVQFVTQEEESACLMHVSKHQLMSFVIVQACVFLCVPQPGEDVPVQHAGSWSKAPHRVHSSLFTEACFSWLLQLQMSGFPHDEPVTTQSPDLHPEGSGVSWTLHGCVIHIYTQIHAHTHRHTYIHKYTHTQT